MSAEATVDSIISAQTARAADAQSAAISYTNAAQTAAGTVTSITSPSGIPLPSIALPPYKPDTDLAALFDSAFHGNLADFGASFATNFATYMATYFPQVGACLATNEDSWICNMILYGGNGIPASVDNAIWDREIAREQEIALRAEEDMTSEWAGRGFLLPSGALVSRLATAQMEAAKKAASIGRDRAIKNIEIQIENVKFAITEATKLRLGAAQAAIDYIKSWFLVPQTAIEEAKALTDTKYRLWQITSEYYRSLVAVGQLTVEVQKANMDKDIVANSQFVSLVNTNTHERVAAAVQSAAVLGAIAQASMGSQNTLGSVSNNTNA